MEFYLELNLYCLAITKIYNPQRNIRDYWWNQTPHSREIF